MFQDTAIRNVSNRSNYTIRWWPGLVVARWSRST